MNSDFKLRHKKLMVSDFGTAARCRGKDIVDDNAVVCQHVERNSEYALLSHDAVHIDAQASKKRAAVLDYRSRIPHCGTCRAERAFIAS